MYLPHIKAEVGLLIATNIPKAMEPWQVIKGVGPYTVKTALGWVINGPLRKGDSLKTDNGKLQSYTANCISIM